MPKVIKDMTILDARIEQIVSFPNMDALKLYLEKKDGKILYDINFGFGDFNTPKWEDSFIETAIRHSVQNELLLHICFPYNSIEFNKNGILCGGENA